MSKKVKITADAVLEIIEGIFGDDDINVRVDDRDAPEKWRGRKVNDILNVEYYTYKYRPLSTQSIIEDILRRASVQENETPAPDTEINHLAAYDRAFCRLSLGKVERLYSKDVDLATIDTKLEYCVQTEKVKLVEYLVDISNTELSGLRIPVTFPTGEVRRAVVFFDTPSVSDVLPTSPLGEITIVEVPVTIMLTPDVVSYSDYTVSITFTDKDEKEHTATIPLSSLSIAEIMTQEGVPSVKNPAQVGNINLSRANSFVLVFEGYNNDFINFITDRSLKSDPGDNNEKMTLTIARGGSSYKHSVIVKDHKIDVAADTGNETHTLSLVTYALKEDNKEG